MLTYKLQLFVHECQFSESEKETTKVSGVSIEQS